MNAILKFKALRSVLKALDGTYFRSPNDSNVWINRETKKAYKSKRWTGIDPNNHADDFNTYFEEYDDRPERFRSQGKTYVRQGDTYYNVDAQGHPTSQVSNPQFNWVRDAAGNMRTLVKAKPVVKQQAAAPDNTSQVSGKRTVATGRTGGVSKRTPINWGNKFNDFMGGLSQEQQDWLKQNGLDNAQALQTYLDANNYYEGGSNSKNIDNKFGNNSKAAWDKFVASGIMGKNRDQEIYEEKLKELVLDAEDPFGYKTSNTYEGNDFMSKVKGMGIRSNADLINFMHNSGKEGWKGDAWQTQFRSDVDRALGGDYSDANIRKVFGTQGKWGRGFMGRGDFGDFQNALQTNAGVWNGMYDRKQEEARMDAGRQQYAAKQALQYAAPQLAKPTVENPANKYIVGKTGTTTLGSAGSGSMGKPYNWMEAAALTGYLPKEEETEQEFVPEDWMFGAYKSGYMPKQ